MYKCTCTCPSKAHAAHVRWPAITYDYQIILLYYVAMVSNSVTHVGLPVVDIRWSREQTTITKRASE